MQQQLFILCVLVGWSQSLTGPDGESAKKPEKKPTCSAEERKSCDAEAVAQCWDGYVCCETWGKLDQCKQNKDWMRDNCKVTCGACKKENYLGKGCVDLYEKCDKWAGEGECKKNEEWMKNNCRKSCNSCDLYKPEALEKDCDISTDGDKKKNASKESKKAKSEL